MQMGAKSGKTLRVPKQLETGTGTTGSLHTTCPSVPLQPALLLAQPRAVEHWGTLLPAWDSFCSVFHGSNMSLVKL